MVFIEAWFVMFVLHVVAAFGRRSVADSVCSMAVLLSFLHAQKANGIAERFGQSEAGSRSAGDLWGVYLAKEAAWVTFFVIGRSWPALAGSALFIAYPLWRRVGLRRVK